MGSCTLSVLHDDSLSGACWRKNWRAWSAGERDEAVEEVIETVHMLFNAFSNRFVISNELKKKMFVPLVCYLCPALSMRLRSVACALFFLAWLLRHGAWHKNPGSKLKNESRKIHRHANEHIHQDETC
jgi:hypothetical protein